MERNSGESYSGKHQQSPYNQPQRNWPNYRGSQNERFGGQRNSQYSRDEGRYSSDRSFGESDRAYDESSNWDEPGYVERIGSRRFETNYEKQRGFDSGRDGLREDRYAGQSDYSSDYGRGTSFDGYGRRFSDYDRPMNDQRGGDRSFYGRGPKGYKRTDDRICEDICEKLYNDASIDASEIEVKVNNAEVTLSGTVEDRRIKRMVEDICEDVSGVQDVHNEIRCESKSDRNRKNRKSEDSKEKSQSTKSAVAH